MSVFSKTIGTKPMQEFLRLKRLPPYVFNITGELKASARGRGEDIIDFGMGNPDGATPKHIVDKMIEQRARRPPIVTRCLKGFHGYGKQFATGTSSAMGWSWTR
jgi:hypothetical protein